MTPTRADREQRAEWRMMAQTAGNHGVAAHIVLSLCDALDAAEARVAELERKLAATKPVMEPAIEIGMMVAPKSSCQAERA